MATNNPNKKLPPSHMTDGQEPEWGEITGYVTRNGTAKYVTEPYDNKQESHILEVNHDATWSSQKADGTKYKLSDTERSYKLGSDSKHTDGQVANYTESNFNNVSRLSQGITALKSIISAAGEKLVSGTGEGGSSFKHDTAGNSWSVTKGDKVTYNEGSIHQSSNDYVIGTTGQRIETVGGEYWVYSQGNIDIGGDQKLQIHSEGALNVNTTSTMELKSLAPMTINSSATMTVGASGDISVESQSKITFKVGASTITMEAGKITIVSPIIDLNP